MGSGKGQHKRVNNTDVSNLLPKVVIDITLNNDPLTPEEIFYEIDNTNKAVPTRQIVSPRLIMLVVDDLVKMTENNNFKLIHVNTDHDVFALPMHAQESYEEKGMGSCTYTPSENIREIHIFEKNIIKATAPLLEHFTKQEVDNLNNLLIIKTMAHELAHSLRTFDKNNKNIDEMGAELFAYKLTKEFIGDNDFIKSYAFAYIKAFIEDECNTKPKTEVLQSFLELNNTVNEEIFRAIKLLGGKE